MAVIDAAIQVQEATDHRREGEEAKPFSIDVEGKSNGQGEQQQNQAPDDPAQDGSTMG